MALICDTGPLYGAIDRKDASHHECARLLAASEEPLVVPAPVLVELEWLVSDRIGEKAFDAFLEDVEQGRVEIEALTSADYVRIRALCLKYEDLPLGLVDASVVAVAERLGEAKLATLDRRHFGVIRPRHVRAFTLLP